MKQLLTALLLIFAMSQVSYAETIYLSCRTRAVEGEYKELTTKILDPKNSTVIVDFTKQTITHLELVEDEQFKKTYGINVSNEDLLIGTQKFIGLEGSYEAPDTIVSMIIYQRKTNRVNFVWINQRYGQTYKFGSCYDR